MFAAILPIDNLLTACAISSRQIDNYCSVYRSIFHENAQFPLWNSEVGITAIQADTQLREEHYDWLLQILYSGEMNCNLAIELSVIFASTLVARHDYNLHSRIDFPENASKDQRSWSPFSVMATPNCHY
jgi:hypothetical protein